MGNGAADGGARPSTQRHVKRHKANTAAFFADSDESGKESEGEEEAAKASRDELAEYLALPQIKYKTEQDALNWWKQNAEKFPNLAVMARQYLGCPASSASVERLFSKVGIAFAAKRKRAHAETLEDMAFAQANLP